MSEDSEAFQIIHELLKHVQKSTDMIPINAIYRSPAQSLREQADNIEKKDALIDRARDWVNRFKQASAAVSEKEK